MKYFFLVELDFEGAKVDAFYQCEFIGQTPDGTTQEDLDTAKVLLGDYPSGYREDIQAYNSMSFRKRFNTSRLEGPCILNVPDEMELDAETLEIILNNKGKQELLEFIKNSQI